MEPVLKPLPDLCGTWRISRRVFGENTRFEGLATIEPVGNGMLRYSEEGTLCRNSVKSAAYRHYIYEPSQNFLRIKHPDGSLFVELAFKDGQARATHICGSDRYEAYCRIDGTNSLVMAYDVHGPRKNYRIVTYLERQVAGLQVA